MGSRRSRGCAAPCSARCSRAGSARPAQHSRRPWGPARRGQPSTAAGHGAQALAFIVFFLMITMSNQHNKEAIGRNRNTTKQERSRCKEQRGARCQHRRPVAASIDDRKARLARSSCAALCNVLFQIRRSAKNNPLAQTKPFVFLFLRPRWAATSTSES